MDELKQNLPLEDTLRLDTPDTAEATMPIATEEDVVTALTQAEQTLPASDDSVIPDPVEEIVVAEENAIIASIAAKRNDHIQQFKMDFSLDDIPDAEGMQVEETPQPDNDNDDNNDKVPEIPPLPTVEEEFPTENMEAEQGEGSNEEPTARRGWGCLARLIFVGIILVVSCVLAAGISSFLLDVTGSTRNSESYDVLIPDGASTDKVASILKENDLIGNALYFRLYSRLTGADGKWQPGAFTLQGDMGFATLIETLQVSPPRETVTVMLREGLTVDEMAVILEENNVCSKQDFLDAVLYGDYDYDFVRAIPTEDDNEELMYRVYRLEGYLFPDTYEFYVGSLGETVVDKMLANFENRITADLMAKIEARGWTLDEAVTFASMVQGEGDTRENMDKVSRVLHNRLAPKSGFTKLQLCCTRDYANELAENDHFSIDKLKPAYNTYEREGFPIGPIGNPGMDALLAAVNPSEDEQIMKCYYFATDYKTGTTYFSKTLKEHQAVIKKYGITDLG